MKIVRGSLKGSTGVIAGYTSDDIYFIYRDCDRRERGCPPVPDGPFLRNEFELLEAQKRNRIAPIDSNQNNAT